MCNIEDLLKWIELRPCMYIGEYKFDNLYHFLNGFLYDNPNLKEKNRYERFLGKDVVYTEYSFEEFAKNPKKIIDLAK